MAQTCLFSHHTFNLPNATGEPMPLLQYLDFLRIYSGMLLHQQDYNKNHTLGSYAHHPSHIPQHTGGPAWFTQNARPFPHTLCKWFPHQRAVADLGVVLFHFVVFPGDTLFSVPQLCQIIANGLLFYVSHPFLHCFFFLPGILKSSSRVSSNLPNSMTGFFFQFPFSEFIIALDKTAQHFKKPHSSNPRAWAESQPSITLLLVPVVLLFFLLINFMKRSQICSLAGSQTRGAVVDDADSVRVETSKGPSWLLW